MIVIHACFSFISTMAFGVLTNVPRQTLIASGFTGAVGWLMYCLIKYLEFGAGVSNFVAAIFIGCLSILMSRLKKMPMILFIIPSLVPLVPGSAAYQAVREFVLGDTFTGFGHLTVVIMTSGAIAGGFMVTSVLEESVKKWAAYKRTKR